jgi:hypothetical protein
MYPVAWKCARIPFAAFGIMFALTGCGSGVQRILGSNDRVEVWLESLDVNDLRMVITPEEGPANAPNGCSETNRGFGCDASAPDARTRVLKFTTTSTASTRPYHVYITNNAAARRRFELSVLLEGSMKLNRDVEINPGETFFAAKIFRNSATRP